MSTMTRSLAPLLVLIALLSATSTSEASVTKKELLATFDEVIARLPDDKAVELERLRPRFEALDEAALVEGPATMSITGAAPPQTQSASAPGTTDSGALEADPVGASSCPARGMLFLKGEQVRVTGDGFAPNEDIEISLGTGEHEGVIATFTADQDGRLDGTITIPLGETAKYPAHTAGIIDAVGPSPTGTLWLNVVIEIASPTGDSDGDGVPDYCDMCPGVSSSNNTDTDGDSIGDVCDPCPNGKDSDGDGQCDDVDPCKFDPLNDEDGDGVCGDVDNCPEDINPDQADSDGNGIGDECQTNPTCSDGIDNDGDGRIDSQSVSTNHDTGCSSQWDDTETRSNRECDDGVDNDGDGYIDARLVGGDPGCASPAGTSESPECSDGIDNDNDGRYDADGYFGVYGLDFDCGSDPSHDNEAVPVPEPTSTVLLAAGGVSLALLHGSRELRRSVS